MAHGDVVYGSWGCSAWFMECMDHGVHCSWRCCLGYWDAVQGSWGLFCVTHGEVVHSSWEYREGIMGMLCMLMVSSPMRLKVPTAILN